MACAPACFCRSEKRCVDRYDDTALFCFAVRVADAGGVDLCGLGTPARTVQESLAA